MIHFSKSNPFAFIWNIEFGISCRKQISSPTFKTYIYGEEEWNLYYYPKKEDGTLDRLVLKRALIDKSKEHVAINFKMEIITSTENLISSGELQDDFSRGGYHSWDVINSSFEISRNLNDDSSHNLTIKVFIWGFSTENEVSRIFAHTEVEQESASMLWKIDDFRSNVLESKLVSLPTTSAYRITFELNEVDNAKLTFNQINCTCEGPLYLNISVSYLDSMGHRNSLVKADYKFDRTNKTWRISPFIKSQIFGENSILVNDILMLYIKLNAQTGKSKENIIEYQYGSQLLDDIETKEIQISPTRNSFLILQRDFSSMYKDRTMTDVTIRIGEKSIQAHKCVLSARSPVFCAMFEQQMLENTNSLVDIQDINYDTIDMMLKFLYDAVLPDFDFETAKNLLIASDKYQLLSLREECVEFLRSSINDENVCEILILSDMLSEDKLRQSAIEFMKPDKKSFLKSTEWKELTKNNRVLATEVLTKLVMDE